MKKYLFVLIAFLIVIVVYNVSEESKYVIPADAIRLRIIPNSNSLYDQYVKLKVKNNIEPVIEYIMTDANDYLIADSKIKENINLISDKVEETLTSNNYDKKFNINYGLNYFPEKEYKGVKYEEGMYNSLVIKLGEAKGDNWWCVLFPPICFVEASEDEEVEYKFLIKDLFDKLLEK